MLGGSKITDVRAAELRAKIKYWDSLKEKLEQQQNAIEKL